MARQHSRSRPALAEQASLWSPPEQPGLQLMRASFRTQSFPRHSHEGYGVGVIEQGALGFDYRGERLVALPGRINTVNPDEIHTGQAASDQGWTYRMFYFGPEFLGSMAEEVAGRPCRLPFFTAGVIEDPALAGLVLRTHVLHADGAAGRLERESLLLAMFAGLLGRHAYERLPEQRAGREHAAVARTMDYLHSHFDQDLALDALAQAAHLSPYHLIRVFSRQTGLTPHAWLMQLRARKAGELLGRGVPLAAVAAQAGFADQSHLTRVFKRLTGLTPGQFRNSVQGARAAVR